MDRLDQLREQLNAIGAATDIPLQDRSHDLATVAGDYAVELLRRSRQQRSDQIDPPPSYNETMNTATVPRTEDVVPASAYPEDRQRHSSNPSTSSAQLYAASSQTTIPQAAQPTEVTPEENGHTAEQRENRRWNAEMMLSYAVRELQEVHSTEASPEESSRTAEQREIRRQNATRVISHLLREMGEIQPPVEITRSITNPRSRSTASDAVGGSIEDYHSDTALLVFQRERIDKLEREVGTQVRTIESLHRKVNIRDEIIEKDAAYVKLLWALVKEKEDLLQYEWSKLSFCCLMVSTGKGEMNEI
ncbi:hypothetical protein KVR01_012309 [Diaporthe batatas]|uniref:uncharacterized protein n=1 Tax=Diaporthe batatas TaxID=748121 RepID=UPI001D0599B5|nr:uncharacterized protein KVR01_012309 [Diaporthe batatas]KAG8158037.1 hypothetical protein KVR01_012309 [Diaporthe batatas]